VRGAALADCGWATLVLGEFFSKGVSGDAKGIGSMADIALIVG
jgi:hypothetical protein